MYADMIIIVVGFKVTFLTNLKISSLLAFFMSLLLTSFDPFSRYKG